MKSATLETSAEFIRSLGNNLEYWRLRTQGLSERQFAELDAEWPNILRAAQFGAAVPAHRVATAQFAVGLLVYVERRAVWREWIPLLSTLVNGLGSDQPSLKCSLLIDLGQCLRLDWQLAQALAAHRQAEALASELGDDIAIGRALFNVCEDRRLTHAYGEAEQAGAVALAIFAEHRPKHVADVLNSLGFIAYERGDYALAEERLQRAVELFRQAMRPVDLGRAINNLANALIAQKKHEAALAAFAEAAQVLQGLGSERDVANIHLSRGTLYFTLGRLAEAEHAFELADSPVIRRIGSVFHRALIANNLGNVYLAQSRFEAAAERLQASIRLWRQIGEEVQLGNTLGTLGEAEAARGQTTQALKAYDEALEWLSHHPENAWARKLYAKYAAQRSALMSKADVTHFGAI